MCSSEQYILQGFAYREDQQRYWGGLFAVSANLGCPCSPFCLIVFRLVSRTFESLRMFLHLPPKWSPPSSVLWLKSLTEVFTVFWRRRRFFAIFHLFLHFFRIRCFFHGDSPKHHSCFHVRPLRRTPTLRCIRGDADFDWKIWLDFVRSFFLKNCMFNRVSSHQAIIVNENTNNVGSGPGGSGLEPVAHEGSWDASDCVVML